MIDQQQTLTLLQMSLQAKDIQMAEKMIANARLNEGFTTQLLLVADNHSLSLDMRLTALVTLKTTIDSCYVVGKACVKELSLNDKAILRESILQALIRSCDEPKLLPIFSEIIYLMAQQDYPQRWPGLLDKITTNIHSGQAYSPIYGSLIALKSLASIFEKRMIQEKSELFSLVAKTFPSLQILTSKLFQNFNDQTAGMLLLVLKIFNLCTYNDLPPNLKVSESLHTWLIFMKKLLDFKFIVDITEVMNKLKHKSSKIIYRFIQHHANPKYDIQFAEYFHKKYAVPFLESFVLQILNPLPGTIKHKTDRIAMLALTYLYRNPQCRAILDKHKQSLVPLILERSKLSKKDLETWLNDPVEFVHSEKQSRKEMIEVIRMFQDSPQAVTNGLARVLGDSISSDIDKEIFLFIFSEMCNEINEKVDQPILIDIVSKFVVPLMNHPSELLRARACEVFTSYFDLPLGESVLQMAAGYIYQCFNSSCIPIKTHAAGALSNLLVKYDHLVAFISPFLTDVLSNYLKLIDIVDCQEVVYNFESLIGKLSDKIQPYAINIIKTLQTIFYKFCQKQGLVSTTYEEEPEDDENQQNTGSGCLGAIRQVLSSNLPQQAYLQLSNEIYQLVSFILADSTYSFLEEGLNILNLYIFKINVIPQQMLIFYPILTHMIIGIPEELLNKSFTDQLLKRIISNIAEGRDKQILNETVGSLRNYIAKMHRAIFTCVDLLNVTFINRMWHALQFVKSTGKPDDLAISETLLITLLENNIGLVDDVLPTVLTFAITELKEHISYARLRLINLEVILMCLYYNSTMVLQLLDSQGFTDSVLQLILENTNLFKADYEKQRLMLGLIKLLEVNEAILSVSVAGQKYAKPITHYLVQLTTEIVKLRIEEKEESEASEAEQDNSHVFGHNQNKQVEDDDCEIDWEEEYNKLYQSPLDNQDEIMYLMNFFKGLGSRYVTLLTVQEQELLTEAINKAEQLKQSA